MKKAFFILLLLFTTIFAQSAPVSIERARKAAAKFLSTNTRSNISSDANVAYVFSAANGTACIYVFNTDKGFVLVSADDRAYPILGYSEEGQFDINDIPDGLNFQLLSFVEQIEWAIQEDYLTADVTAQWQQVESDGNLLAERNRNEVESLLKDTWNQNCYYNDLCPVDSQGPCGHTFVGCTSLAIGQIMRYWEYPIHGQGSVSYTPSGYPMQYVNLSNATYDYENMPDILTSGSPEIERTAVATFLWHIGVAMHASYGPSGTSAIPSDVPAIMRNNFLYANDLYGQWKDDNDTWISQCKASLDQGYPIHYSGWTADGAGHSFVCDGYNANDQFHFNWGWSGTGNGFFTIGALNVSGHQFNSGNYAVFNIHPINASVNYTVSVSATPSEGGTVSGGGTYNQGEACTVIATPSLGYTFVNWTENGTQVSTDAHYNFTVNGDRTLVAHFQSNPICTVTTSSNPATGGTTTGGGSYFQGQSCTIHATANTGYSFVNWTLEGLQVSTNANFTFIVTGNLNFVANFSQNSYTITTSASPISGGTTNGGGTFIHGQSCTVTATPNPGYAFVNWTNNGTQVSTEASYTFSVTENANMVAHFETGTYDVIVDCDPEMGSVSGGGNFGYGQTCAILARANEDFVFDNWSENGTVVSTESFYSFVVTEDRHLTANFSPSLYEIIAVTNPENGGTITGTGNYALGESVTLSVQPATYFTFENWTENGEIVSTEPEYTFTVEGNRNLVANLSYFDGVMSNGENDFKVYPNPAHDYLIIEGEGIKEVEVYNLYGQLLLVESVDNVSDMRLNLRDMDASVCFVVLHTESGTVTKCIVKD